MKDSGAAGGPVCPERLDSILLGDRQARGSSSTKITTGDRLPQFGGRHPTHPVALWSDTSRDP